MDFESVLFHQRTRKIGIVIPDVVITEKHTDELEITSYPVESPGNGGDARYIADHAYRKPAEVVMETGFSSRGTLLDFVDTSKIGLTLGDSPKEIYRQLLDLQRSRVPFSVTTGKRIYENMLIKSLVVNTDITSENVLMATIDLVELMVSATQSVDAADKSQMTQGVNTSAVQNVGTKTVIKPTSPAFRAGGQS